VTTQLQKKNLRPVKVIQAKSRTQAKSGCTAPIYQGKLKT